MKSHKRFAEELRALCDDWHSDDGIEARETFRREKIPLKNDERRVRQLCKQVYRAVSAALGGICNDPVLQDLEIMSVEPAPDASNLLVAVRQAGDIDSVSEAEIRMKLNDARGFLRLEIANAITRKKVPELTFCIIPDGRGYDK